ncbi:MAG: tRNA (adenosine(37)-N6)-dimethylallyltransferase MiaA [candidate division Zixibacteria bacterium]|nr:tRNA (adenosine(37)-N6)-dimethylallyltransferase MiaA [candidate division Zixibacteria bacterium]
MIKNSVDNSSEYPVIPVLVGPTASGKTTVATELADKYPQIEIISADSRQIYKHLSIGTDKPSAELLSHYNFHLVDFVEPGERYTAFDFVEDSVKIIEATLENNNVPLICGGTGLYVRSLVEGIVQIPDDDFTYRAQLEEETITKGPKYLYEKLQAIDPIEAEKVHPHNIKKIIRALEIYHLTGKPKSELLTEKDENTRKFKYKIFCLNPSREKLYKKINSRVDIMIKSGLLDEVESLIKNGKKEAITKINVIGYNELFRYFDNEISLETATNLIKQNSRRYAKRQITWFNGTENISFYEAAGKLKADLKSFWTQN